MIFVLSKETQSDFLHKYHVAKAKVLLDNQAYIPIFPEVNSLSFDTKTKRYSHCRHQLKGYVYISLNKLPELLTLLSLGIDPESAYNSLKTH
jgi:hypothetical protein